jgi:hypothetical protein
MAILLMVISGYFIGEYFIGAYFIGAYWWLLMVIILVAIGGCFINGY